MYGEVERCRFCGNGLPEVDAMGEAMTKKSTKAKVAKKPANRKAEKCLPVKEWEKLKGRGPFPQVVVDADARKRMKKLLRLGGSMAGRQIDAGKVKEVDERLRDYRKLPTELREKERDHIATLMILALSDDPENELSRHCDAVMDGLVKLAACYVPSTVKEEDYKSRAKYMAAVAHDDTDKRRSWFSRFLKLFPGLRLEPSWRLSCLEEGDSENGFKTLFLDDGKGGFCEDVREHMRLVGNPAIAALDIVLLDYLVSLFKRPALHKLKWLVTGLKKFLVGHGPFSPNSDGGDMLFGLFEKGVKFADLAAYDYLPRVELNADGSAVVRYVTFSPSNGFEETVVTRG